LRDRGQFGGIPAAVAVAPDHRRQLVQAMGVVVFLVVNQQFPVHFLKDQFILSCPG
jgi:hypothetical protein